TPITPDANGEPAALPDIAGPEPVGAANPALARALDTAFASEEGGRPRSTRAVVVVHDGRVVAERYASGIGVDTPLLSHSIAKSVTNALGGVLVRGRALSVDPQLLSHSSGKSVTNALVGVLVRDGALSIDHEISAPAWRSPLTVDQLLRMDSGLPVDEGRGAGA